MQILLNLHPRRVPVAVLAAFAMITGLPCILWASGLAFPTGCFLALLIGFFGGMYLARWVCAGN